MFERRVAVMGAASGWGLALALMSWATLAGQADAARWSILVALGALLVSLHLIVQRAEHVVCQTMSMQIRIRAAHETPQGLTRVK